MTQDTKIRCEQLEEPEEIANAVQVIPRPLSEETKAILVAASNAFVIEQSAMYYRFVHRTCANVNALVTVTGVRPVQVVVFQIAGMQCAENKIAARDCHLILSFIQSLEA